MPSTLRFSYPHQLKLYYVSAGIKFSICEPYNFWILYSYSLLNLWCDLSNWLSILLIFGVICRVSLIPCISLSTPLSISYFRFSLPHAHLSLHLLYLIKSLSQVLSKLWLNWGLDLFKINYLLHENDEFLWYSHPSVAWATSYMRREWLKVKMMDRIKKQY